MTQLFVQPLTNFAALCSKQFFGLPTWYKYLETQTNGSGTCDIINFKVPGDFLLVGLAVVDILLRLVGLLAVFYVIYGGIQYVTSQGQPEQTAKAQSTIISALIGMAIAFIAVAAVAFIGHKLGA